MADKLSYVGNEVESSSHARSGIPEVGRTDSNETKNENIKYSPKFQNVVKVGERLCVEDVFQRLKRKRIASKAVSTPYTVQKRKTYTHTVTLGKGPVKEDVQEQKRTRFAGKALKEPHMNQPATTPQETPTRRSKRINRGTNLPIVAALNLPPWIEKLSMPPKCTPNKVTMPQDMDMFLKKGKKIVYKFPWGKYDIVVERKFWYALLCYGREHRKGWLSDQHLDIWVDLMWRFRPPKVDWAMADPFFSSQLLDGSVRTFYGNGTRYPVPWSNVEKVYFTLNVPTDHFLLAKLQIRNGVVTFYHPLEDCGVFKAKCIRVEDYKITFQVAKNVPRQADKYGDCGVWVCIFLYRLSHNLDLDLGDPLEVAMAYREHMVEYFWKHKVPYDQKAD
ncbi:hypothetical protein CTI12_AA266950 [Artemisia annua]|uniref:Ubiquitin-like protease family profile domain-containing protein n=1 Tax=Artemisia annua TaxID=35608 RepID=A0A2U1NGZ2_ARTAN|nr:hypothetical protein CTI12_AA266950 [Artemisia annua]